MSGMHRFWSIYDDAECNGAPTGVFIQRRNECASQVASSGAKCEAQYDGSSARIGFVDESCYDGRVAGLGELYGDVSYMAYDYYYDSECTAYENSASYRFSGDCETLYDGYSPVRSATISTVSGVLVWARNLGSTSSALNCPGASGGGYYEFHVPVGDINAGTCKSFDGIEGGFVFYNNSAVVMTLSNSGSSLLEDSSSGANPGSSSSALSLDGSSSASSTAKDVSSGSGNSRSDSSSGSSENPSLLSVGTIVGLSCGAAVVIALIAVLVFCFWKKSKENGGSSSRSLRHPFLRRTSAHTGGPTDDSDPSTLDQGLWNDNAIVANRVPRDKVNIEGLLCRGGFGEIYRGTYNREAVAIKMLFPDMRSDLKKVNLFLAEAKLSASFNHPHIVRFVGVSWGSLTDLCLLSELMKGGDLRTLLKEYEERGHPQGFDHDKIRIAYHVAQALTYLHSMSPIVVHRDLKSKNVLLTEVLDAKLTDFGVSRERQEHTMTAGVGTMLWMAPEVMMAEHYDERADIFSFGVLLSELDSQSLPFAHARCDSVTGKKVPDAVIIQRVASGALKAAFSPRCVASVVKLGNECLALDPSARPSAPMAVFRLQKIMKKHFSDEYII